MIEYLIDGPLWYFSLAVFCIGVLWQLATNRLCQRQNRSLGGARLRQQRRDSQRFQPLCAAPRDCTAHPACKLVAGYMFHLGLFALLFFAAPHVLFLEEKPARFRLDADAALGLHHRLPVRIFRPHPVVVTAYVEFGKSSDIDAGTTMLPQS